jgi:hypothetical protein
MPIPDDKAVSERTDRMVQLERMVRRLALKLERVDGQSLATEDARRLVDFEAVPSIPIEIEEAKA